jgi:tetratricopeptide (TPR) repeat protein
MSADTFVLVITLIGAVLAFLIVWLNYQNDKTYNPKASKILWKRIALLVAVGILLNTIFFVINHFEPYPETDKLWSEKIRARLTMDIRKSAKKRIGELEEKDTDWRKVVEIEKWRDQMLADIDRILSGIADAFQAGEASKVFQKAQELLQERGAAEALAYLESKSDQRWKRIDDLAARRKQIDEKIRKSLREALLEASILETQFRFDDAETNYRKVLLFAQDWAWPRNDFVRFLIQRGIVIEPGAGKEKFKKAIIICRETIKLNPKEKGAEQWAESQYNLGSALSELGTRTDGKAGADLLAQAVTAYREALTVYTRDRLPQLWATIQNNLGRALSGQGARTGGKAEADLLAQAVIAYREVLAVYTRDRLPQQWAATQINLGSAIQNQGIRTGGKASADLLAQAVIAYRKALTVYTRDRLPQDWASTQNNLGIAFRNQGIRTSGKAGADLLAQAVTAYREALTVYTRNSQPQKWATTQNNLGIALQNLLSARAVKPKRICWRRR